MMRLPNTVPIPAPEPATPTVAAPAPMNLAAVSMSLEMVLVWKLRLGINEVKVCGAATLLRLSSVSVSGRFSTTAESDRLSSWEVLLTKEGVETNLAHAYIFRGYGAVAGELELQKQHCKHCPCSPKDILISRKSALANLNGPESRVTSSLRRDAVRTLKSRFPLHSFQDFLIIKWLPLVWTSSHLVPSLRPVIHFP